MTNFGVQSADRIGVFLDERPRPNGAMIRSVPKFANAVARAAEIFRSKPNRSGRPDLQRIILLAAFGNVTVHVDVSRLHVQADPGTPL